MHRAGHVVDDRLHSPLGPQLAAHPQSSPTQLRWFAVAAVASFAVPFGRGMKIRARRGRRRSRPRSRTERLLKLAVSVLPEVIVLRRRGYLPAGSVVVRCREGHLFTTIWVPGVSVKALRLGPWRLQRCPVGNHWSIVTPVRRSELNEEQARTAADRRDIRLP
jgi:hypothetical protein